MKRTLPLVNVTDRTGPVNTMPVWPAADPRSVRHQQAIEANARAGGVPIEADPFNILILNYTMKCPLACDYCCYSCGPLRTETMALDMALRVLDQAAELGVFAEAGFTGGDPLVLLEDVLVLARRMHDLGLPFSMISACDWAETHAETARRLDPLAALGMSVFTISFDRAHERFVDIENVRRAARRTLELGVRLVLCGSNKDETSRLQNDLPEFADDPQVSFVNRIVLPGVGRLRNRTIDPELYGGVDLVGTDSCYKRIYHDVTVFWDGEVYPCCSVYNRETPGISYGNVLKEPLAEIWDRIDGSLLLRTIKHGTFSDLYAFIDEHDPSLARRLPDKASALGPCHLCHLLFSDSALTAEIKALYEDEERRRVADILRTVQGAQGDAAVASLVGAVLD